MMRMLLLLTLAFTVLEGGQRWREEAVVDGDPVVRGAPKDGMEVLDFPPFVVAGEAGSMEADDLVIGVTAGDAVTAYPVLLLYGREIVNDTIGDTPITATW